MDDDSPGEVLEWSEAVAAPFPESWREILRQRVPFYRDLGEDERRRFEEKVKIFVYTKTFSSADRVPITDEVKVVVAAAACRLTMNMSWEDYRRLRHVALRAGTFKSDDGKRVIGLCGDAKVVLSWPALVEGLARPDNGDNVGYHEFAHVLDGADGAFDGDALSPHAELCETWARTIAAAREAVERARRAGVDPPLDAYGAKSDAELFAVATEWFFERPRALRERLPALYDLLRRYYDQDPAGGSP